MITILQKRLNMCVLGQTIWLFFLGMFDEHAFSLQSSLWGCHMHVCLRTCWFWCFCLHIENCLFPLQLEADQTVKRICHAVFDTQSQPLKSLALTSLLLSLIQTEWLLKLGKFGPKRATEACGGWNTMKVDGWIGALFALRTLLIIFNICWSYLTFVCFKNTV